MNIRQTLLIGAAFAGTIGAIAYAQAPGTTSVFPTTWAIPYASIQRTYSQQATNLSPVSTGASDLIQLCGNASVVTKLNRITVSGRATAVAGIDLLVIKRSSQDQGGVPVNLAPFSGTGAADHSAQWTWSAVGVPYDASDGASLAAVTPYSSGPVSQAATGVNNNWAAGTTVGILAAAQLFLGNATTGIPGKSPQIFDFGKGPAKAVTLRSPTQCIALGVSPTGLAGNLFDVAVEWTEE